MRVLMPGSGPSSSHLVLDQQEFVVAGAHFPQQAWLGRLHSSIRRFDD
jgi:hypothetical protein